MKLFSVIAALACATFVFAQTGTRPDAVPPETRAAMEPPAMEWLKANITPFAVDVPTSAELKPLMERLQGARVVGLGEATHGDQQSQLFKTHAIRELVRQGRIDALMLEVNRQAGAELDAYVNDGKGDLAQLILDGGIFSIWRTDEFASLIMWLRAHVLRTGKPIRIYGIDCQSSGYDFEFALQWLQRHDRRAHRTLTPILKPLIVADKMPTEFYSWLGTQTQEDYKRFLTAGLALVAAVEKQTGKPGHEEALYAARVGVQGLEVTELEFSLDGTNPSAKNMEYYMRRDVFMARNLITRLGDRRAALWAHDMHTLGDLPDFVSAMGYRTTGTELRGALKGEYVSVGFAWSTGAIRARLFTQNDKISDAQQRPIEIFSLNCMRPGDLGEFLSRVGPDRWYVDFRNANEATKSWGALPYYRGWCGWALDPKTWLSNPNQDVATTIPTHDILVFHRTIGPSTTWALPSSPPPKN